MNSNVALRENKSVRDAPEDFALTMPRSVKWLGEYDCACLEDVEKRCRSSSLMSRVSVLRRGR